MADLRGYGASGTPASTPDHAPYAKSAMALDMCPSDGDPGFSVSASPATIAAAAFRLSPGARSPRPRRAAGGARHHPDRRGALQRADAASPSASGHGRCWRSREPLPERLIAASADTMVDDALGQWGSDSARSPPEVRAAYIDALRDPATVHAICEEYRAAATIDFARDSEDREAGRRIACPVLALWSGGSALDSWYERDGGPLGVWRQWASDGARPRPCRRSFLSRAECRGDPSRSCDRSSGNAERCYAGGRSADTR